jgi:hypothetical protein
MFTPVIAFEQLAGEMGRESGAARRKIDRAWMGLGIGNELGDRIGRKRWIYQHDKRPADESRDRRDVADEIEIEPIVERRVYCVRRIYKKERVAVRRRTHDRLGADIGASARTVLNDEWLAQAFRQPLAHQAHDNVGRAAGTSGYDPAHRPRRIGLRPRHDRLRGSARSQTQECAAGKFHGADSSSAFLSSGGQSRWPNCFVPPRA